MITCAIIDDEPLARDGLSDFVRDIDFLQLAGTCTHPLELTQLLDTTPVDLLFLDIQMPKMTGLDWLKRTRHPPMVVLTTAYSNYAVDSFELGVLDYLLKPITFDRFFAAASKARDYQRYLQITQASLRAAPGESTPSPETFFFIKCGNRYEQIILEEIRYIESLQNYISIVTTKGKFMTLQTLKFLEQQLDPRRFIRVHRSYMVAIDKITRIDGNELTIGTHTLPVSRTCKDQLMMRVDASRLPGPK